MPHDGQVFILRSTIQGNHAGDEGGGVLAMGGELRIEDSTLDLNTAGYNGGALLISSRLEATISQTTISGNSAGVSGGGLAICAGRWRQPADLYRNGIYNPPKDHFRLLARLPSIRNMNLSLRISEATQRLRHAVAAHTPAVLASSFGVEDMVILDPVSYTHLTLPTKRIV